MASLSHFSLLIDKLPFHTLWLGMTPLLTRSTHVPPVIELPMQ